MPVYVEIVRAGRFLGCWLLLAVVSVACMHRAQAAEALVVSQDHAWPPFAYLDSQGEPRGLLIELWQELGAQMGRPVTFKLVDWPDSIAQVRDGHADVHGGLLKSEERSAFLDFSVPLMPLATFAFVAADSMVVSLDEFADGPVGVTEGSYELEFMLANRPDVPLFRFRNNDLMVQAAVRGEIRAFVADYPVGMYLLDQYATPTDFRVLESLYRQDLHVAVPKGEVELLEAINVVLGRLDADELARLTSRWLRLERVTVVPGWLLPTVVGTLVVLGLSVVFGYVLLINGQRRQLSRAVEETTSELRQSEAKFRTLVENANDTIFTMSPHGVLTYASPNWTESLGHEADQVVGKDIAEFVHPDDLTRFYQFLQVVVESSSKRQGIEYRVRHKSGEWRWHMSNAAPELDASGAVIGFLGIARDITERKKSDDHIRHLAHFDVLTDLPNRALFSDRLQQALKRAARFDKRVGLLMLDFDEFKQINDTFGHAAGDRILQQAGRRVQACLRESDTVGRIGGDEFVVLLPDIDAVDDAMRVVDKILAALSERYDLGGRQLFLNASIGIALAPLHGKTEAELFQAADSAMYQAKADARRQAVIYETARGGQARP